MIKCKVIERFHLGEFDKLMNIKRFNAVNEYGMLEVDDEFECDEQMANYLTKSNKMNRPFVKIIEVVPEEQKDTEQPKPAKKTAKKKNSKKK